jgi:general secretion pathway protein I
MTRRATQLGFTMLEIVIAFAIAALALLALYQGVTKALGATGKAAGTVEALRDAQSLLAAVGTAIPADLGEQHGEAPNGFGWRILITPVASRPLAEGVKRTLDLRAVEVIVTWRVGARTSDVALSGYRLITNATPPG